MSRLLQVAAIALTLLGHGTVRSEDEDPAARWLTVYGWIQTADRLAGADQWSLALGSYLEANRLLADLAESHPAFEPEMVAYRRGALADSIAAIESRLTEDDHVTMMKYLDFIESLELGEKQRYDNEFEAALGTLGMAKALLDEISSGKPEGFREAVASQYERLRSGIEWLDSQVNFKARSRPAVLADDPVDWGTTRFVKESDLPGDPASVSVSPELFPPSLASVVRDESTPAAEPAAPSAAPPSTPGPRRFRMTSRGSPVPENPQGGPSAPSEPRPGP
jgi:hypothetical protein